MPGAASYEWRSCELGLLLALRLKGAAADGAGLFYPDKGFISFTASSRNIGSVRNPLLLKGVTDASGKEMIKIIKRAHL
jgi:hypothetical protein